MADAPGPEPGVRPAQTPADREAAAEALALAFGDDPCWSHLLPDPRTRVEKLLLYFSTEIESLHGSHREVWITGDGSGAAVWAPPGRWRVPLGLTMREAGEMRRVFGRRLLLGLRTALLLERRHPKHAKHWYLHYLGVEPARQGRGLGTALLAPILERCDSEGIGAHLESSTDRNRVLYERNDFALKEIYSMPGRGGPPVRSMWRQPRPAAQSS
jgi:GNAT superfamily N-acetyltransferase